MLPSLSSANATAHTGPATAPASDEQRASRRQVQDYRLAGRMREPESGRASPEMRFRPTWDGTSGRSPLRSSSLDRRTDTSSRAAADVIGTIISRGLC